MLSIALSLALPLGAAAAEDRGDASDPRPSRAFYEKAESLARWIGAHSDFGPMRRHPSYVFVSKRELQYIYFQGGEQGYTGAETATVEAMYVQGIMFLQTGFDLETQSSILLHELVHHLQHEEGRQYACIGAAEAPAYRLQNEYIRETGIGKESDPLWTVLVTRCPQSR